MEAITGWIKTELLKDFYVTGEKPVEDMIDDYIRFFNEECPAYSLNYMMTIQYKPIHSCC